MADVKAVANVMGIVGIIGAILMIVGVFLSWIDIETVILGNSSVDSYSGWAISDWEYADELEYSYAPILALACGVIALITTVLPMFVKDEKIGMILGIVSLLLAIVAVVIMFLFKGDMTDAVDAGFLGSVTVSVGIGFWLAMVGAIITALGGILDIVKDKF
ncbi:MAG: hypothetical protein IJ026_04690 [Candidatus Methanomethylophilaceae archaeon]|nr:hypothetical protein [Candidatus Methanomethylophilaceae archaeon]